MQKYHRDHILPNPPPVPVDLEPPPLSLAVEAPPPPALVSDLPKKFPLETTGERVVRVPTRKVSPRRGSRRSASRRHRKTISSDRDTDSS